MTTLSFASDIFKTVLGEIDSKYIDTYSNCSGDSDDSSDDNFSQRRNSSEETNKKYPYKAEGKRRRSVQWIDECEKLPLATESRRPSFGKSNTEPKPILKHRANCFIFVSEWIRTGHQFLNEWPIKGIETRMMFYSGNSNIMARGRHRHSHEDL